MRMIAILFFFIPNLLYAAQDAVIIKDSVEVHAAADNGSEVIESRSSGERIRISSFHKDGWYKVKTTKGTYGWIYQTELAVDPDIPELKAASIDLMGQTKTKIKRESKSRFLRPQVFSFAGSSTNIGGYHYSYPLTAGFMTDLAFRLNQETKFLLRAGFYKSGNGSNDFFAISRAGFPLLMGLEFLTARSYRYNYTINILGGYDFAKYTISASKPASPSSINASASTPIVWISYTIKKKTSANTALLFDIGGFFATRKSSNVGQAGFLGEVGSPDTVKSRFSGLALSFGYEFPI